MELSRRQAAGGLLGAVSLAAAPAPVRGASLALPPQPQPAAPAQVALSGDTIEAGVDPFARMTAPVLLNGHGPYPFMLDTGANITCIARRLADELKLPILEPRPMHTMVGIRTQPIAVLDELRVGRLKRRDMPVLAADLPDTAVAGVLGVDWLDNQRVTLDFASNSVEFAASAKERGAKGRVVVPAHRRLGQLTIVDAELGAAPVSAMIDSGSQDSLCNRPLMRLLAWDDIPQKREVVSMVSVLGEPFQGEMVYLPFLRLGGLQLGNVPVVYADTHVFEIWGLADRPAVLLGMDLLKQFRAVSLDFGRSQVRFDLLQA